MFDLCCSASFGVKQISNLFSDGGRGKRRILLSFKQESEWLLSIVLGHFEGTGGFFRSGQ